MVGRAGLGRRVGGLPRRQADRGRPAPGRGPGPAPRAPSSGDTDRAIGRRMRAGPIRSPPPATAPDEPLARRGRDLHAFRLVKGRVFCLRGPTNWSRSTAIPGPWTGRSPRRPAQINPEHLGRCRSDRAPGRPAQSTPRAADRGRPARRADAPGRRRDRLDAPPMPVDEDSVLVVLDPRTVKKLDLEYRAVRLGIPRERGNAGQRRRPA